ncbi:MAG: serine protease, partial [Pseudomonadota bacterium]
MSSDIQKNHTRLTLEQATVKISTSSGFKGSGFFISPDGYILTAWHCIAEIIPMPFSLIKVETIDGNTFEAQLDKEKSLQANDIAVLKIDYTTEHCVPLGLITEKNRGDEVIAIGYPAGYIEGRSIGVYDGTINQLLKVEQTDIDAFETTAIEGQGQSGGLIYHFATRRLIGLAKEIYHNEVTKTTGLAVRFDALFEKWPDCTSQQVDEAWDEYLQKGPKPLTPAQLQRLLTQVNKIQGDLTRTQRTNWPFPVHKALTRLRQSSRTVQDYLNVFEALVHLHFVTLASQFYWIFTQQKLTATTDELQAGLAVLHESLVDPACGGATTWLRRSAILSLACHSQSLTEPLPFPELVEILEPATLTLAKNPNTNPDKTQPDFWLIEQGGERWTFLTALVQLRRMIKFYEPLDLDEIDETQIDEDEIEKLEEQLKTLLSTLTTIFQPYRGTQLALVSETLLDDNQQRQVGIHCYWQDEAFLCATNRENREDMADIWEHLKKVRKDLFRAPTTPRPDWQWDESLLLYQPEQPYKKAVYLMPLGFRYRDVSKPLPGLLDSVRWKDNQVASVLQRTYQESAAPDWHFAAAHFRQNIERLVQELCENFAFKAPLTDTQQVYIPPQFDLQHDRLATQIAANTVERPQEIARVLSLLKNSPAHRLLLEGGSGSGKSVLLAQIYQSEPAHTVFVSMDLKPEALAAPQDEKTMTTPSPEKANVALRVGMYCLTVLNRLMDLPPPNEVLTLPKVQAAIRDNLNYFADQHPQVDFMIVLDGANQAPDPGGLLSGLPGEILNNLYILVSSQVQERVRQPLNIYTDKVWELADISVLAQAKAEAVVWHYWTQKVSDQKTPQRADLPDRFLQNLCQTSHNVPIFLEDGTRRLRAMWADDPHHFVQHANHYFQQAHATALPKFLKTRLEEIKQAFEPVRLLDALLWCLSLIQKSLSIRELQQALQALRRHKLFADLPAVSNQQIEDGLSCLGGFLRILMKQGEDSWQLSYEMLGQWFCEQHGQATDLPSLRLALVPYGAVPLPEKASEAEFGQWLEWVRAEDYEHYESLASELQVSVLDSLLAHLSEKEADHALVLAHLGFVFLFGTGEQQRGFALESALQQASQQHHFPARIRAYILQILGDIQNEQNQLDKALEYFERSLSLSEQLLKESATPQNRR